MDMNISSAHTQLMTAFRQSSNTNAQGFTEGFMAALAAAGIDADAVSATGAEPVSPAANEDQAKTPDEGRKDEMTRFLDELYERKLAQKKSLLENYMYGAVGNTEYAGSYGSSGGSLADSLASFFK